MQDDAMDRDMRNDTSVQQELSTAEGQENKAVETADNAKPAPEIKVIISRDRLQACLEITSSEVCRQAVFDEVLDKINSQGVVFGLKEDEIRRAINMPGMQVVCAEGIAAENGEPASIKYYIDTADKGRPAEMKDGKVDFRNLNLFTNVKQDDLLAEKIPATPGTPGTDVFGKAVLARPGKDLLMPLGKNVHADENLKIYADISGQLQIVSNKISVVPVIEIHGDVDLSTGNIDFVGNVVVKGSVREGFTVKAGGNVEIAGTVSGSTIEGQNITIKLGIQGMHTGYIKAKGKISAKFIENAVVYAGSEINVADVILHSRVNAGGRVIVEGRRGLIAGGQISAGEEIKAKVVGTQLAPGTILEVGVNPMLREEYQQLRQNMKKMEYTLDQTQKALNILRAMDQDKLSPEKRQLLLKLTKNNFHVVGRLDIMRKRKAEIEASFEEMRYGRIKVSDTVFPGVKIVIGTEVKMIREIVNFVTFYVEDGEFKIAPFK